MTVTTGVNERLAALTEAGVSVWLDQIRRGMIESGELQRLVEESSLRGVTSNPAIFEKAILGSTDYDDQLRELAQAGKGPRDIYEEIAIQDVQMACDVLRDVWEANDHDDGFVSIEVMPDIADDTDATIAQARDYWDRVDRPNLMVKIPGTDEGVPAIEESIAAGINVNVTLLFSVEAYAQVAEAYIRGLERRREAGESTDIRSVASFFVSRVDTEVDKRLEALGRRDLLGTAAIANARAAYAHFKEVFHGDRFAELAGAGARVQRPLWASTGVKNPHYKDTMYVEELVAPETVNTMPMATLLAFADHGEVKTGSGDVPMEEVQRELQALADAGIDMNDVTAKLLRDGVKLFVDAMEKLIAGVESQREAVVTGRPPTIESVIPDELEPRIAKRIQRAGEERVAQRIWAKDATLWGGDKDTPELANRLGWLTISESMLEHVDELREFAGGCLDSGLTDVVLLGMGGSSLAPEVFRRSFGKLEDGMTLHVLDSTDPGAILTTERAVDLSKTLFLVSSKSGGTIETLSQFKHFHARVREAVGDDEAGNHFVAITDPGSKLADLADDHDFRALFLNDPDIGGRYSALSYFGLVPAALMGVDVRKLLEGAQVAETACANYDHSSNNSGLWLGCALGELALAGRDKLTFAVAEPIGSFGLWVEQLIAESLGKQGRGALPVAGEPVGSPDVYGPDRVFIHLQQADAPEPGFATEMKDLGMAGHPVLTLDVDGPEDLGRVFFFAEFATAVAGWVLEVNPFDQPNVQEAKDATQRVLEAGDLPEIETASDDALRELIGAAEPPHYVAILGFVQPSDEFDRAVEALRVAIRDARKVTTTFGYGPRYLHSTGQFHKGGPPTGRFLQLIHDGDEDVEIPDAPYTFRTLKNAQAIGDLEALRAHERPAERVRLEGDPVQAVEALTKKIKEML
ncbi:MAG: transaldolase / glucose-6-phosphate isomerase [Solirubrobacteraceae bacterium]|nr:transaldolase / glucose-6-phosphate isomerase [Solirubrobacteraceae bacterium]